MEQTKTTEFLLNLADKANQLAARLSLQGSNELTIQEKELIRLAYLPEIRSWFNESLTSWLVDGNTSEFNVAISQLMEKL